MGHGCAWGSGSVAAWIMVESVCRGERASLNIDALLTPLVRQGVRYSGVFSISQRPNFAQAAVVSLNCDRGEG